MGIETIGTRSIYRNRWLALREDQIRMPDGTEGIYTVVEKADFAVIIPKDGDDFIVVEQFRYTMGHRCTEFPQGAWEDKPGIDPEVLARGELQEETGFTAREMKYLGKYQAAYGFTRQAFHIFLATGLAPGQRSLDAEEFDLTSRRWIERFVAALASQRLPLYAVLTYDGREDWQPPHPADAGTQAAFADHQRGDKGFGPAAGPDACEVMAEAFRKTGFAVSTGDSSWLIDDDRAALRAALAEGIADAVRETGRLDPAELSDWLSARRSARSARIGHQDLWARPV